MVGLVALFERVNGHVTGSEYKEQQRTIFKLASTHCAKIHRPARTGRLAPTGHVSTNKGLQLHLVKYLFALTCIALEQSPVGITPYAAGRTCFPACTLS